MPDLGIYIQVPFCASKCSFCNFSSGVTRASVYEDYTQALIREIENVPAIYSSQLLDSALLEYPANTLYIGGGTPSILAPEQLTRILNPLRERFRLESLFEFTLEVTPGSADDDFLAWARSVGLNRLSIGAQTFNNRELAAVGRLHNAQDTCNLVHRARATGLNNLNLDLVGGLPFQTESSWRHSLEQIARLRPEHVSVYLFEIDEKSRLGREVLQHGDRYHASAVPDGDFMADAYESAREVLRHEGYQQYEISNFALPGWESRHNLKYWQLAPYVGLGAGAHSFDGGRRWSNVVAAHEYHQRVMRGDSPIAEVLTLTTEERLEEFFFLGLRQSKGVDLAQARRTWGSAQLSPWIGKLAALEKEGLLESSEEQFRLTERAYLVSNEVFQEFVTTG